MLATKRTETVRDFVNLGFKAAGIALEWPGTGQADTGPCLASGRLLVRVSPRSYRPAEAELLVGDPAKARREPGWEARITLEQLCRMMDHADMRHNECAVAI